MSRLPDAMQKSNRKTRGRDAAVVTAVPKTGGTIVNKFSARVLCALTIVTASMLLARTSPSAENANRYSDSSLNGTFVFRTRGSSLFTLPGELTSNPVYLASIGLVVFDGRGLLHGSVSTSATRTDPIPAGKYIAPYSSQIQCNAKMSGTYEVNRDGMGTMTITFTPINPAASCGESTGVFTVVIVTPNQIELVSSGQMSADPSKGEFNSYVVEGELTKRLGARGEH